MKHFCLVFFLASSLFMGAFAQTSVQPLDGKWNYRLDPKNVGESEKWYNSWFTDSLLLPGSLNTNGIGDEISVNTKWTGSMWNKSWYESDFYKKYRSPENTKIVFWLTPNKYYVGKAWYQRKIVVPSNWKNRSVELNLERCHWRTSLWLNGKKVGNRNSLAVPHRYELSGLKPGKEYNLTLCVDNSIGDIQPGLDAHSISDNTQTNWNGIVGDLSLVARPKTFVNNVRIEPDIARKKIHITLHISSDKKIGNSAILMISASAADNTALPVLKMNISIAKGDNVINADYDMSADFRLWDEFSPNLYSLNVKLLTNEGADECNDTFGLRQLGVKGTQITVNGRPVFFRGTLECCIFPKTGFPATDENQWKHIMETCKAYGLNHIRFHSWCPPEAAFRAADRLGIYLYVECDTWSGDIGSGKPIDKFVYDESKRIIDEYGNHPSFCLMSYGNEPWGKNREKYLRNFVSYWKQHENRLLFTTAAGWPAVPECDWLCVSGPRIQRWGEGVKSIINSKTPNSEFNWSSMISKTQPTISHEIGQWCVYPDLKERAEYTGVLKAKNFDIFEDRLRDNGLLNLADSFLLASGKLQTLCYKADIEAALRTKDFGGFQLLDLHDFPGQGSAIVGVLNPFWKSKGYVTPQQYSEFCNSIVPLALMPRFVYRSGDTLRANIEVAQFSQQDLNLPICWKITAKNGRQIDSGVMKAVNMPTGALTPVGNISHLVKVDSPQQWELAVEVGGYKNRWSLWAYPDAKVDDGDVMVASSLNEAVLKKLSDGGKVLLSPVLGSLRNEGKDSVVVGFSSIFWNTLWTNGMAPHTLGILCNPAHPALRLFPTEYHSNYQWQDAMSHCNALPLHKLGDAKPIVRIIDDWFTARSLGLIVELKVGNGSLMLCGVDLLSNSQNRPEAVQLTSSLLDYMKGGLFHPSQSVTESQLKSLFVK